MGEWERGRRRDEFTFLPLSPSPILPFFLLEAHQRHDVVRAAGLDARSHAAFAHAAERLAKHDGAGRWPVYIEIAGADALSPMLLFSVVETFESRGEAVAGRVHQIDRVIEIAGFHHTEHGAEQLRHMCEVAALDTPLHAGTHQVEIVSDAESRHDGPLFARLQLLEPPLERATRRSD